MLLFIACTLAIHQNCSAQLNGTYTVGGISPDYVTVDDAVSDILLHGVSGDVIFSIRPGYYPTVLHISSLSYVFKVTFKGESGNADDVVIAMSYFYDCSNILFKHLSFNPYTDASSIFHKGMELYETTKIVFDSCNIIGLDSIVNRNGICILGVGGSMNILNCNFKNLDNGVFYQGATPHYFGNNIVFNCTFDSVKTAIQLSGVLNHSYACVQS